MIRVLTILVLLLSVKPSIFTQNSQPNIILIVTDDQGWGDLSFHGNKNLSTPNIDSLAKAGASFSNFYVAPVCSPTRAELLTGIYHARLGVKSTSEGGERFDKNATTIADVLKRDGYRTAAFGKWHNGSQAPYHPNSRGFEEFYGFTSGHWGNYFNPMLEQNGKIVQGDGYLPDDLTNKSMAFIEENQNQPFFLYLPYNTPHSPMQVPESFYSRQEEKALKSFAENELPEDTLFTKVALAMVENLDWNIGRLVHKIKSLELTNTMIIYLSDNGPNSNRWNSGMRGRKGSTDEGGVRSPLFISWEGVIEADTRYQHIASSVDLMPTILEISNASKSNIGDLDGVNLFQPQKDRVIINDWKNQCSLRSEKFRLDNENRLYHIPSDRSQSLDVSSLYPGEKERLLKIKKAWIMEVKNPAPSSEDLFFTIGHSSMKSYHLPARDAKFHGGIKRSNRWPNCSYLTNWTREKDQIYWDIDVLDEGDYDVEIFYTCSSENLGSKIQLLTESDTIDTRIELAFDPPLRGANDDRVERMESYVKDFKPLKMGNIHLKESDRRLVLRSSNVLGHEVADFRLLILKKNEME